MLLMATGGIMWTDVSLMRGILLGGFAGKMWENSHIFILCLDRTPLNCSCGDVDQIDEIHINDMTETLFEERYCNFVIFSRPIISSA